MHAHSPLARRPSFTPSHFFRVGSSQITARLLLAFDRFEESFEVTLAEATAALALDDLEEYRWPILDGPGEDLQHVALVVAIHQYAQVLKLIDRLIDFADTILKLSVVA